MTSDVVQQLLAGLAWWMAVKRRGRESRGCPEVIQSLNFQSEPHSRAILDHSSVKSLYAICPLIGNRLNSIRPSQSRRVNTNFDSQSMPFGGQLKIVVWVVCVSIPFGDSRHLDSTWERSSVVCASVWSFSFEVFWFQVARFGVFLLVIDSDSDSDSDGDSLQRDSNIVNHNLWFEMIAGTLSV